MARSKRMSVQKRLREKKKAEAAALKREGVRERPASTGGGTVAARKDLESYGVIVPPAEDSTES